MQIVVHTLLAATWVALLMTMLFFTSVPIVLAATGFQEDFSAGNLEQWQLENGEWQYWSIRDQALYATINKSRKLSTLVPKSAAWSGLANYRVEFLFQAFNTTDKNFVLGWFDSSNFYDIHFYNNQLIVEEIRDGLSVKGVTLPFPLLLNHRYQVAAEYSRLGITLWMDGQVVFTTDNTWLPPREGGRFGVKIATGGVAYSAAWFDEIVATPLFPQTITLLQTDPAWAAERYDHHDPASSQSTIATWGCALSAAAMLLRSHGFTFLPDGLIITPASLNEWLRSQADGYVADGLVNWLAITRLTRLLSEAETNAHLPKLEFQYYPVSDWTRDQVFLQESLITLGPQIGTDGEHFFVIDDYTAVEQDFSIRDPLYPHVWLQQKQNPLTSLRIFTPSQTDLSYLLLVVPKTIEVNVFDALSQALTDSLVVEETIAADTVDSTASVVSSLGEQVRLLYYRQPPEQLYRVLFSSTAFTPADLTQVHVYLYQSDGMVQEVPLALELGTDAPSLGKLKQVLVTVDFKKNSPAVTTIETISKTEDELKMTALTQLTTQALADFKSGQLSFYVYYKLTLLIDFIRRQPRYFYLLDRFREFHQL